MVEKKAANHISLQLFDGDIVSPPDYSHRGENSATVHHKRSDGKYQPSALKPGAKGAFAITKTLEPGDIIEFSTKVPFRFSHNVIENFVAVDKVSKDSIEGTLHDSLDAAKPKKAPVKKKVAKKTAAKKTTSKKKAKKKTSAKN